MVVVRCSGELAHLACPLSWKRSNSALHADIPSFRRKIDRQCQARISRPRSVLGHTRFGKEACRIPEILKSPSGAFLPATGCSARIGTQRPTSESRPRQLPIEITLSRPIAHARGCVNTNSPGTGQETELEIRSLPCLVERVQYARRVHYQHRDDAHTLHRRLRRRHD